MPRLCAQARATLAKTPAEEIAPELTGPAARQAKRPSQLYATGLARLAPRLGKSGQGAAKALAGLAAFLEKLPAKGSPRLGKDYTEAFRLYLDESETPEQLLPHFRRRRIHPPLAGCRAGACGAGAQDYMPLKIAAHQPHKIRALFLDKVYTEGWGTFVEGLMLDQGWGGPNERLAHLKKALENCAAASSTFACTRREQRRKRSPRSSATKCCRTRSWTTTCGRARSPPPRRSSPTTWARGASRSFTWPRKKEKALRAWSST